jgi:hypothetical protein
LIDHGRKPYLSGQGKPSEPSAARIRAQKCHIQATVLPWRPGGGYLEVERITRILELRLYSMMILGTYCRYEIIEIYTPPSLSTGSISASAPCLDFSARSAGASIGRLHF